MFGNVIWMRVVGVGYSFWGEGMLSHCICLVRNVITCVFVQRIAHIVEPERMRWACEYHADHGVPRTEPSGAGAPPAPSTAESKSGAGQNRKMPCLILFPYRHFLLLPRSYGPAVEWNTALCSRSGLGDPSLCGIFNYLRISTNR